MTKSNELLHVTIFTIPRKWITTPLLSACNDQNDGILQITATAKQLK
ncbi:MAG: hypothetical protein LBS26_03050 [Campylobacteraceae bacterium]|nr:hypothetical protein [Campylobacteraceae bacterium]